jgi:hypothetical protein
MILSKSILSMFGGRRPEVFGLAPAYPCAAATLT